MIISFSGTDGVGKSTQMERLIELLKINRKRFHTLHVRENQTPFSHFIGKLITKLSKNKKPKDSKLWYVVTMLEFIHYWCFRLKAKNKRNNFVLCDRHIWDTYIDLWKLYGKPPSGRLWSYLEKHAAMPDISLLYVASEDLITKRLNIKNESDSNESIKWINDKYLSIQDKFDHVIDASTDEDQVYEETKRILKGYRLGDAGVSYPKKLDRVIRKKLSLTKEDSIIISKYDYGGSLAQNYCVCINGKPRLFAKLYPSKIRGLKKLTKIINDNKIFTPIVADFPVRGRRIMLTDWVFGKEPELNFESGYTVGKILKDLHSIKLPKNLKPLSIKGECNRKILGIKLKNVHFPHKEEILKYLKEYSHLARDNYSLTHMDVHLRNFLVDKQGNYFLIDYENLAITDPWRDLTYGAIFHTEEKDDFWYGVLYTYFEGKIPDEFWKAVRFYSYLHLLRLISCEHEKGLQEQIDYKANLIWDTFNCYENDVPRWFKKYKKD